MSPRKRARPNPAAEGSSTSLPPPPIPPSQILGPSQKSTASDQESPLPPTPRGGPVEAAKQVQKARSWYGSWPRAPKSSASTQVIRETIAGDTSRPPSFNNLSRFDTKRPSDLSSLEGISPPDIPATAPSETPGQGQGEAVKEPLVANQVSENEVETAGKAAPIETDTDTSANSKPDVPASESTLPQETLQSPQQPSAASGWMGWFTRAPQTEAETAGETPSIEPAKEETQHKDGIKGQEQEQEQGPEHGHDPPPSVLAATAKAAGSWFGYWYGSTPATADKESTAPSAEQDTGATAPAAKEPGDVTMEDAPPLDVEPESKPQQPPSAGSTWAFWSRDTGSKSTGKSLETAEQGELAIIGEGSEAHPTPASPIQVKEPPAQDRVSKSTASDGSPAKKSAFKKNKRQRPQSMDIDEPLPDSPATPRSDVSGKVDLASKAGSVKGVTPSKPTPHNLLLPSFSSTYRMKDNPSILRQIANLLLRTQQPPANHVFLSKEKPKVKKSLAIGVHGLFPASYLRPMIGQPTGTSIKFANHSAEAIRRWADANGCEDCEIEKVALEGDGKISDRVENLWKLLLNWIDHIRSADLIVVACHSQGVPVGIILVAKLIELGIITTGKIGICAMAGVSLGPFPDYKSGMGMLMGSASELWEFANPESEVSRRLEASLKAVLSYGVRITYVGSIDDQLVPLESAVYSTAHHPYIYRAVFIDGRVHAPDFIAHLVGFALKLRNLGISDHGLIRELSVPLAGSLYSGEGHSRLYDDPQVYDLAVTHALETIGLPGTSASGADGTGGVTCTVRRHEGLANPNPYHLPWIMRGMLEEDFVKTELGDETTELLRQFDDWKPVTKALKDVKYRLEVVRSKL